MSSAHYTPCSSIPKYQSVRHQHRAVAVTSSSNLVVRLIYPLHIGTLRTSPQRRTATIHAGHQNIFLRHAWHQSIKPIGHLLRVRIAILNQHHRILLGRIKLTGFNTHPFSCVTPSCGTVTNSRGNRADASCFNALLSSNVRTNLPFPMQVITGGVTSSPQCR